MEIALLLNNDLNFIFLKKNNYKYIIIYNKLNNTYIKYKFNLNVSIHFFKNLRYIIIKLNYLTLDNNNLNLLLNKQIKSINFYFVKKIVFFGKGFKIKKLKNETIRLFFNKSHINFIK
jgi:hypothetical protein